MPKLSGPELAMLVTSPAKTFSIPIICLFGSIDLDHHVIGRYSGTAA